MKQTIAFLAIQFLLFLPPIFLPKPAHAGSFRELGSPFTGLGSASQSIINPHDQKFYLNYYYSSHPGDLVVIDPNSTPPYSVSIYPFPEGTRSAPGMIFGPDNNLYLGTILSAHILKFDTTQNKFVFDKVVSKDPDSQKEQTYVYKLTLSPYDHKIYGCTQPSADLIRFDPNEANPTIENLGSLSNNDPALPYASDCTADSDPVKPYIYVGLGRTKQRVVAYNIATKAITTLASSDKPNRPFIYQRDDGQIAARLVPAGYEYYLLSGDTATKGYYPPPNLATLRERVFANGDKIEISPLSDDGEKAEIIITHPNNSTDNYPFFPNKYPGSTIQIFRLGLGPDNNLYFGGILPFYLTRYTLNPPHQFTRMGYFGAEPYSMLTAYGRLNIASYESKANLMSYDTAKAISPQPYVCTANANPQCVVNTKEETESIRPMALVAAPGNDIFIGSTGIYGQIKGPLIKWNLETNQTIIKYPFDNLGVTSLAYIPRYSQKNCKDYDGTYCLVGGTTRYGGAPSNAPNSLLFTWNPQTNEVINKYPIPGLSSVYRITNLIQDPKTKYVLGMADQNLFIFNPANGVVGNPLPLTFTPSIASNYNNVAIGSDGNIWGLAKEGIFTIDITNIAKPVAKIVAPFSPEITSGFAIKLDPVNGDVIYFGSGDIAYSYHLVSPTLPGDLNNDKKVDDADFTLLKSKFNNPYTIFDYNNLVTNFGK